MDPFFIYLLKCGGIITLFFAIYFFLLRHETFFAYNRYFLLSGIVIALLLPLLVFTKIIYVTQPQLHLTSIAADTIADRSPYYTVNWTVVFLFIYVTGVSFFFGRFIIQLLSLFRLIRNSTMVKNGNFKMLETKEKITPFSFFNYIVYHPGTYDNEALNTIIEHEKIHAGQWHSIDILLTQLLTIFLWINPLTWMYKKSITQNLEYIADGGAARKSKCMKKYQYLLLNASTGAYTMALTNNFFNSLIKKRIVMLNKSKSQQKNMWKYGVILPFLIAFLLIFNIKTIAQTRIVKKVTDDEASVIELIHFSIDKNTTDEELDKLKAKIKGEDGTFTYKGLERNSRGEITSITIKFRDNEDRFVTGNYSDDDGIQPIVFGNNEKGGVFIVSGDHHGSDIHFKGSAVHEMHFDDDSDDVIVKGGKHKKIHKVKKADSPHSAHSDDESDDDDVIIIETVGKHEKGAKHKKISSSGHAIHIDAHADDDVIIIEEDGKHKKGGKHEKVKIKKIGGSGKGGAILLNDDDAEPMIFIDGEESTKQQMKKLNAEDIEKVEVIKGDGAVEKYGKNARDGVILITTKKD